MSAAYARRWICEERLANLISDLIVPRLVPGRFKGSDKSRIVDGTEIHSVPVRAVEEAIAFVQKHALHAAEIGELHRKERWSLPPVAVREAVINAVVHTDYAQRGAPLRISIFVQWGSGIQRITAACRDAGLAAPVFEEIATRFRVTIGTARIGRPTLDQTDDAILGCLAASKGLLTSEIAKAIGLTPRATRTRLARLVGRGLVSEVGTGPQDPRRRYFRTEKGNA
jgi:ATP-dependent DNA helicase RecG